MPLTVTLDKEKYVDVELPQSTDESPTPEGYIHVGDTSGPECTSAEYQVFRSTADPSREVISNPVFHHAESSTDSFVQASPVTVVRELGGGMSDPTSPTNRAASRSPTQWLIAGVGIALVLAIVAIALGVAGSTGSDGGSTSPPTAQLPASVGVGASTAVNVDELIANMTVLQDLVRTQTGVVSSLEMTVNRTQSEVTALRATVALHDTALSVVAELRATLADQNTTQSDDVTVLNGIIAEQNSTIAELTNITLQHSLAISAQNVSISNLTQTLEPFPVFNKLRVGNSVYNMYSASLPVQRIQYTSYATCTVGSDPLFPYGAVGGGSECQYAQTPYLSLKTSFSCGSPTINQPNSVFYHVEFQGHVFGNNEAFSCRAIGYLVRADNGHVRNQSACTTGFPTASGTTIQLTTYCAPTSDHLVFRFFNPSWALINNRWHASDILANYVAGNSPLLQAGAAMAIVDQAMHINATVF
eukprot:m.273007 g.273007  ORF g.273007 m.273007 type:complete len:473 (+) comp26879_c0_seq72:866-2284(+)